MCVGVCVGGGVGLSLSDDRVCVNRVCVDRVMRVCVMSLRI